MGNIRNMDKSDWVKLYSELDQTLNEYNHALHNFRNGKNATIRKSGERSLDILLSRAKNLIFQNHDLHALFDEEVKQSGDSEVFFIDEFFDWNYFHKDMPEFLERVKNHIQGL
jgi:hypothetical protein